jgi:uncharacterized protein YdaU (DUF1376 family)
MSRAWIAFYMGDYQKDTNRLTTLEHGAYFLLLQECWTHGYIPLEPQGRAAIAKMPLKDWLKIAPVINAFFGDDGTQKRATKEIEKAEMIRTKRAMAGFKGGINSGRSQAIRKGRQSKYEANTEQIPSKPEANANQTTQQTGEQKASSAEANHNNISKTTTVSVERSGLGNGNLSKRPNEVTREELAEIYEKRKATAP